MVGNFQKIGNHLKKSKIKLPAYQWQELALRIISELAIPSYKKSAVFKVSRDLPKQFILYCLNDTKELANDGEKWKYFFKLADNYGKEKKLLK